MAQVIRGKPGIGAAFGTGLAGGLNALADAKIKQMIEAPQRQAFASALSAILGANPEEVQQDENMLHQAAGQAPVEQSAQAAAPSPEQQQSMQPRFKAHNPLVEALKKGGLSEDQFFKLAGLEQQKQLRAAERAKEVRKEEALSQREINKRTQPFYDKVIEGEGAAKQVKTTLRKLQTLDKNAKVPPAQLYNLLTSLESIGTLQGSAIGGAIGGVLGAGGGAILTGGAGAPIGLSAGSQAGAALGAGLGAAIKPVASLLRSGLIGLYPDTEEFEKTSLEFLKNVRPLIGGHVTENQLDLFLKSIPTLATTAEGRKTIINNMGVMAEGATAEYDALEEVLDKNNGKRPNNLEFQVMKLADEKRKEYAKRWEA